MKFRALTFLRSGPSGAALLVLGSAFAACTDVTVNPQSTTSSSGSHGDSSTTGAGGASSASSTAASSGSGGMPIFVTGSATSTGTGAPPCNPPPDDDTDGDGFSTNQGDCNDCDPSVNPDAVEIIAGPLPGDGGAAVPVDDDCDGLIDNVAPPCDTGLSLADADPVYAAHAIEICKPSFGPKSWGLVSAAWVLADGAPLPTDPTELANYHLGHGLFDGFGPSNAPKAGKSLLAISTGTARRPGDPGYQSVAGFDKGYPSGAPPGFPIDSPSCPGVLSGGPRDAAALEVALRAPTNVIGFRFDFSLFSRSWPDRVCSVFDDQFVVLQAPAPPGAIAGNIAYDQQNYPLTLNLMHPEACSCVAPPCFAPPAGPTQKPYGCLSGPTALVSTGFAGYAATGWLITSAPVKPGSDFTLRFAVWDGEDGLFDTTVLVDAFRWIPASPGAPISSGDAMP